MSRRRRFAQGVWIAMLVLAGMANPHQAAAEDNFATRTDVAYGPLAAERGDLFLPPQSGARRRPAVLVIHGGGWVNGARGSNAWLCELLANQGFVVFNIDYRLAEAAKPETHWPAQLVDAQLAVRWLRANAGDLAIDPARIGAIGDSAGGTMAVFLGVLPRLVPGDQATLLSDQPAYVTAVVDEFGIMDLAAMGATATGVITALFGTATPAPGLVDAVSPLREVNRRSVPMRVVHGNRDELVPIAQSQQLVQALKANGVDAQLVTYAGGHGFEGVSPEDLQALFMANITWLGQRLGH